MARWYFYVQSWSVSVLPLRAVMQSSYPDVAFMYTVRVQHWSLHGLVLPLRTAMESLWPGLPLCETMESPLLGVLPLM